MSKAKSNETTTPTPGSRSNKISTRIRTLSGRELLKGGYTVTADYSGSSGRRLVEVAGRPGLAGPPLQAEPR